MVTLRFDVRRGVKTFRFSGRARLVLRALLIMVTDCCEMYEKSLQSSGSHEQLSGILIDANVKARLKKGLAKTLQICCWELFGHFGHRSLIPQYSNV